MTLLALAAGIVILPLMTTKGTAQEPAPTYTVLYNFTGGADGANPEAGLIRDAAGNLYGTTYGFSETQFVLGDDEPIRTPISL